MENCCICNRNIDREDAPVLSMGGAGIPRYLCEECEALLDAATLSKSYEEAGEAIGKISKYIADGDPDRVTYSIVSEILLKASGRAVAIKEGTYDFSLDEQVLENEGLDDIPEDLQESEEDKEKDKIEEVKKEKFDKVYNVLITVACAVLGCLFIWKIIEAFFLNK